MRRNAFLGFDKRDSSDSSLLHPARLIASKKVFGAFFGLALLLLSSVSAFAVNPPLLISEFRLRGIAGSNDEFVEIYNNSDTPHTVAAPDASAGYALVASDGIPRFVIPNGTVIPARGHYLGVNGLPSGYSIGGYPAGNGTNATGDSTYFNNISDNAGIVLFFTSTPANFTLLNRIDAVGSTSEANALYKEGAGYPAITPFSIDSSFYRNLCPVPATCAGLPQDTDNNATDFLFVDTNGTSAGAGQRLGAPSPENLSSPIRRAPSGAPDIAVSLVDPGVDQFAAPNYVRDFTSDPANNSTFGTISIRRAFTNNSAASITRLRFRVIDLTTFPAPAGTADLRPRSSATTTVPLSGGGTATVEGTTLEQPPTQINGGGFNSSKSVGTITLVSPLASGSSVNVQFLIGLQQSGDFRFSVVLESLPAVSSDVLSVSGNSEVIPPPTQQLLISEFRLRGPAGANDEFVEIYNNSDVKITVNATDGSSGFALVASDGGARFTIPNGTIIPARGHFLGVNSVGYSLGLYPAGSFSTATGDATYTRDIPDNAGIALFRTANPGGFVLANRLDAVGAVSEGNATYKEGGGYPTVTPFSIDYSFYRNIPFFGTGAGLPQDTDNNASDFKFVDTNGTSAGAGQRLGAPGPENLSSPTDDGATIVHSRLDAAQADNAAPNVARDLTSDPASSSTFGTVSVRRTFTNNTGGNVTRLRFRIIEITTFPSPSGIADLRPRTSGAVPVVLTDSSVVTVQGTTLEQPPNQPNGGGFNSSMSATTISPGTPLPPGGSINLQFLLGVQQTGCYRFAIVAESLTLGGSEVFFVSGNTDGAPEICPAPGPADLIISEFRLRGPAGANDEFVEVYNNSDTPHLVLAVDGSSGYAVVASDGVTRFTMPNGTVIPARGHYLGTGSTYGLNAYPAGNGTTAFGNSTFGTNIPDNAGIALFKTANAANFNLGNRLDAVGFTSVSDSLYKEGAGLPPLTPFAIDSSFYRTIPTSGPGAGTPKDTGDNTADFLFVDTNGTSAGAGQRLGAPGPENLSGPVHLAAGPSVTGTLVDPGAAANAFPNYFRVTTSDPANNSTFGTLSFRRTFTNNTGANLTRLRFRVIDQSTFPAPSGIADLRPRTSGAISVPLSGGGSATVLGTTLEQPPSQPNGGGFNSSMSVALGTPVPDGGSVNAQFLLGVQQTGNYNFCVIAETLPAATSEVFCFSGNTSDTTPTPPSPLIISEFRLRGPAGANDEFIEVYNQSDSSVTVSSFDGSSGYAVVASDGLTRFTIPNGTVIPARGHYLGVNNAAGGYSIGGYPAGNGTTATGNATYTANIADNAGIALFATANPANFSVANRLDAVGSVSASALYKEGPGYPTLTPFSIDYSWYRKIPTTGAAPGLPQDTDSNAADFLFVDTNGTSAGGGQRLGAPGPENLSSPGHLASGPGIAESVADPGAAANAFPNYYRDPVSDPASSSTFGTLSFRRKFTNTTAANITRLRFRIIDLTTFPAPAGTADLRPRTSGTILMPLTGGGVASVSGTTLEQPPSQPNGGGFNSSLSAPTSVASPIAPGGNINLQFRFGVQQTGNYNVCLIAETLPFASSSVMCFSGNTSDPNPTPSFPLIISEFRLRGNGGANDEFVEIYNNSNNPVTVASIDGSAGFGLAASDGTIRFTIPNGAVIPARGHFLGVNSAGYSLNAYPAGSGTTATANASYALNIADNAGIALFKTAASGNFNATNRLDAVGSAGEANVLYKEGSGYPNLVAFSINYSWYRHVPTSGASIGRPQDTNINSADFRFVDTNGTSAGGGQKLGAPGPENLSSPGHLPTGATVDASLVDPGVQPKANPNYFRSFVSDPASSSTFGTLSFRRRFTNNSGVNITRLRYRIIEQSTFPSPAGVADLRARTSGAIVVSLSGGGTANVQGTTLEQPPAQPNGGAINSSLSANTIATGTPLATGASVNLQFLLGVQQQGSFSFCMVIDTVPFTGTTITCFSGDTTAPALAATMGTTLLRKNNSNLVNVGLTATATDDDQAPVTIEVVVFGNEDDETPTALNDVNSPDAKDLAPGTLRLRSERVDGGGGRVYLTVVSAIDSTGNISRQCLTTVVPISSSRHNVAAVSAQAEAARAFCQANEGAPPQGYFVIGDGPVIGPNQ